MIEVEVEDDAWRAVADVEALARITAEATLAGSNPALSSTEAVSGWRFGAPDLTILLTDDASVRDLNARFRGKDTPTNVLSFPAPETAHPHLGDIALAHGVCAAEAAAQGKTLADHLSHLVVHGVLHLLGHDHQADTSAEAMEALERQILSRLGVEDPYQQERLHA